MLDIGAEAFAVDRPVEGPGYCELGAAERAEEREGAPVTVRGEAAQACPFRLAASSRSALGSLSCPSAKLSPTRSLLLGTGSYRSVAVHPLRLLQPKAVEHCKPPGMGAFPECGRA